MDKVIKECKESLNFPILDVYRDKKGYDDPSEIDKIINTTEKGWIRGWNRDPESKDIIDDDENHLFIPLIFEGKDLPMSKYFDKTMNYIKKEYNSIYRAGISRLRNYNTYHKHCDITEKINYDDGVFIISNTLLTGSGTLKLYNDDGSYNVYKHSIGKSIEYEPHIFHEAISGKDERLVLMVNYFKKLDKKPQSTE